MKLKKPLSVGLLAALLATGCHTINDNDGGCHIYGTANPRFNGKKIYLVPLQGKVTAEKVDSFIVNNGQFEFHVAPGEMKIIRVDYHVRLGVEDLLVVAEPGRIEVSIDSVSYGKGTPQNDSLQQWKEAGLFLFDKSIIMSTYILCGFANISSIGILLGGLGVLAPEKKGLIARLGVPAMIGGALVSLLSATLIGMIID